MRNDQIASAIGESQGSLVSRPCDAVVAGHLCLDIIPSLTSHDFVFDAGKLQEVGPVVMSTGGPVSNTGLALNKLGISSRLMGKVGLDYFGQIVLGIIDAHGAGLSAGMIKVPGEVTSYSLILSPLGADRMFLHCPGCNDTFGADDIDYDAVNNARLFHFGYPPLMKRVSQNNGEELCRLLRSAKETGVTTSLDMCMPDPHGYAGTVNWPAVLAAALPNVDIYMPSLEETLVMSYPDKYGSFTGKHQDLPVSLGSGLLSSIASDLLSLGPAIVGLKLGRLGLYLKTGDGRSFESLGRACPSDLAPWINRELWSPCFKVDVLGTTGAGDATIAGFFASLLRGESPERCMTLACAVGACNVEAADALSGLLNWEKTRDRLRAGWARFDLPLEPAGWHNDPLTGVWRSCADTGARPIPDGPRRNL
ncbi:MAG TPA: carbohydrate kinase family protein [Acidobacteriota bacterium]|nr:carbohydrate kinase family protein [Acidobacteriota bacterium]